MNKKRILLTLVLALIVGTGLWLTLQQRPTPQTSIAIKILPQQLPAFTLKDVEGIARSSSEWDGRILIVNFWASWCPPCLEEIPTLVRFQDRHRSQGVQVVGVAVDNPDQAKAFIRDQGINFPVLIGDDDAIELGKRMGNRIATLPYTAIFDKTGKTLYAQPGKITQDTLEQAIKPLL